ncbi:ATP-dependent helicase C-terminal domain-containing protein, partial [Mangrovactinospora gilvigrisea]|uniref:ATP-dependent helicase C-terminal domain-containing protein n=1 Tax=Mangrovactinospora gilvigrisea TaxID=1428644 RepID=UPI000B152CE1
YLMVSGTAAEVGAGSRLGGAEWLAVAVADRPEGRASARVRLAAVLDGATALRVAGGAAVADEVRWDGGDVVARRVERLGAVVLGSAPLREPDPAAVRAALLEGLRELGPSGMLRWTDGAERLRRRMAFLHQEVGAPWPAVDDGALAARAEEWLGPELGRARRRADLARADAADALRRLLPWNDPSGAALRFDALAPERVAVPSGSRVRVEYGGDGRPFLAVKLQEVFGWEEAPALAGGRVPLTLHLLSPAGRVVAVTGDLRSFWGDGYQAVRRDLRGRYPKHAWPEDPRTVPAHRGTRPR